MTAHDGSPSKSQTNGQPRTCKKVPVVMQMEATECGAASLAMVLATYGKYVPLEQVREACGVSRDGSKASSIGRAAIRYGMDVHVYKYSVASVQRKASFPAIIHWNFNHFVVLRGFEKGHALINDPARGRVRVSAEEFERSYTGIILCMEPGKDFERGGKPESVWKFALSRLHGSYAPIVMLMITGVLAAATTPLVPAFARMFTDDILSGGERELLRPLLAAMAAAALFQFVSSSQGSSIP